MEYEVTRIKNGQVESVEMSSGFPFEKLKDDAVMWVESDLADRVEIRDGSGKLVFHHPRVMKPVKNG